MRYETIFPLFLFRQMESRIVRWDQGGKDVLALLETILLGLEAKEEDWNARLEAVELCLSEMQKAQDYRRRRTRPSEYLERAILNLRAMRIAVKQRDRLMALQMGKAVFGALSKTEGSI
jgi:hypothetical protein